MSRVTTLGLLSLCAALLIVRCGTVPHGNDGGTDAGTDAGETDGGLTDGGTDGGTVPSCAGFTPATVAMEVPLSCPTFANCGGDERGRWAYDGGCFNNPFQDVSTLCATATFPSMNGTIAGCVAFDGLNAERHANWTITGSVYLPSTCVPGNCASIETAVQGLFPGATCNNSGGGSCTCSLTTSGSTNDTALYVRDGGTLIVNGVDYPYCVNGDALRYKEAGSSPSEPEGRLLRAP